MEYANSVGDRCILSTCMTFAEKAKDNYKARKDLAQLSNRSSLELKSSGGKPHASFCLKPKEKNKY
jgi:hypothetical protein